jgi:hypothetical protein
MNSFAAKLIVLVLLCGVVQYLHIYFKSKDDK